MAKHIANAGTRDPQDRHSRAAMRRRGRIDGGEPFALYPLFLFSFFSRAAC